MDLCVAAKTFPDTLVDAPSLSHSLTHSHTLSLSLSHTHTCARSRTRACTHVHTHAHAHNRCPSGLIRTHVISATRLGSTCWWIPSFWSDLPSIYEYLCVKTYEVCIRMSASLHSPVVTQIDERIDDGLMNGCGNADFNTDFYTHPG